jgi:hypothetical protein
VTLARVVFCVRVPGREARIAVERRLAALAGWYAALGPVELRAARIDSLDVVAGAIELAPERPGGHAPGRFDPPGPLPEAHELRDGWGAPVVADVLDVPDATLRALPDSTLALALAGERGRIVAAAGGIATLHRARGEEAEAWASHAVAAAWLATARGSGVTRPVASLVAWEQPGGERTLAAEARAVPAATCVELTPAGARERSFWPPRERWAALPAEEAAEAAERRLLAALEARLAGARSTALGLTAGADSLVVGLALRELGVPFVAFTHGDPASPDAAGAARVAAALDVPHLTGPYDWWEAEEGLARVRAAARWHEGGAPVGWGDVPWPPGLTHWVAGIGAETGRAFWYRPLVRARARPPVRLLVRVLDVHAAHALGGADPAVRRALHADARGWVEAALETGATGWRALDVVYAEQRVRRWGRGMAPRLDAALVAAFADAELLRALSSLPLEDRLTDGWPRRFVAARAPELAPAPPAAPPRGALARQLALDRLRELRRRTGLRPLGGPQPVPWFARPPWRERPQLLRWLRDDVLRSRLVADALGERWARETRALLLAGRPHANVLALRAGAAVALDEALLELRLD